MTEVERSAVMEGFGTYPVREFFVGGRKYSTMMGCLDMILAERKVGVFLDVRLVAIDVHRLLGWRRVRGQENGTKRDRCRVHLYR